ncbi:MAG: enoyl-CoA hydratase family protein [Planctomycetes bacterium]|nr:enoyl-CoA hydratase family protein [Planctomycetota bacterium]
MNPQHFRYHEDQGVAVLRLDRPERLNALTFESYRELAETFVALRTRAEVRAVLVTGTGRAFCTGGDQRDIIAPLLTATKAELNAFTRLTCELIANVRRLEKPVVAGLNGIACGAGAVLAAACDVRVAAESAKIAFLFTKVGLSGADMGAAWLLPRIVGLGRASELLMSGEWVDARRAYEIGLYNQLVPDAELPGAALDAARRLAAGPALGLAVTKRMLNLEASMTLEEAMAAEGWVQAECMSSSDYAEGYRAFVEKRAPDFAAATRRSGAAT